MSKDDSTRIAVITGAGSGIGAALVDRASADRMSVVLVDHVGDAIDEHAHRLGKSGVVAVAECVDVSDPEAVDDLARRVFDRWGRTDLLINNAGIDKHGNAWENSIADWRRVIDVNLNGVFYGMRSFIPRMLESGLDATIVNTASVGSLTTAPHSTSYRASKHGCLALTECIADELALITDKIRVLAAVPGAVRTQIAKNSSSVDADGVGARARQHLDELLESSGINPAEAAEIIFDGIARGLPLIHTHPERSRELITARTAKLLDTVNLQP